MAKKGLMVLVLAALVAGGAFAQADFRLSAGAGGYFTSDFGGGVEASYGGATMAVKTPYAGGGGFAFFDATYAEVSVGLFGGSGKMKSETTGSPTQEQDTSIMGLDIGLLGKYPFTLSDQIAVFPLLGINYRVVLSAKNEDGDQYTNSDGDEAPGDFSALWFKLGGGLDFSFTDNLFLRGTVLYGIRLSNKFEKDMLDLYDLPGVDSKSLLGHGLEVKIAIGYRF